MWYRLQPPGIVQAASATRTDYRTGRGSCSRAKTDITMTASTTRVVASVPRHAPSSPIPEQPTASATEASDDWYNPQLPGNGEEGASIPMRVPQLRDADRAMATLGIRNPSPPNPPRPTTSREEASVAWLYLQWPEVVTKRSATATYVHRQAMSTRGEGRPAAGQGHRTPLPVAPTAALAGDIGAKV